MCEVADIGNAVASRRQPRTASCVNTSIASYRAPSLVAHHFISTMLVTRYEAVQSSASLPYAMPSIPLASLSFHATTAFAPLPLPYPPDAYARPSAVIAAPRRPPSPAGRDLLGADGQCRATVCHS